jgi:hypothetical protein
VELGTEVIIKTPELKEMDIKVINEENEFINENQEKLPGLECATLNFIKDYLVAFSEFIKGEPT